MNSIVEKKAWALNGLILLVVALAFGLIFGYSLSQVILLEGTNAPEQPAAGIAMVAGLLGLIFVAAGFFVNAPNEAKVLTVFGAYTGTVSIGGFWWANPFSIKKRISLRLRNFSSEQIKVNDLHGNPIEIAAVVVWQVSDTAKASFDVENYEQFVTVQSETALRALRRPGRGTLLAARQPPGSRRRFADATATEARRGGCHSSRGALDPFGLRPRNRPRHVAAPAGPRGDWGTADDR